MEKQAAIVYTADLETEAFILNNKRNGIKCITASDVRSAVYVADGIAARTDRPVIVCVRGNNASRSAFAGLTEAFYRQLPVALITFGKQVDYSIELPDVVFNHYVVNNINEIDGLLKKNRLPMHIEVETIKEKPGLIRCSQLHKILAAVLSEDDYIYFSRRIEDSSCYRCKKVVGGLEGCLDGGIANVLGASLAQKRRKYVGLLTDEECMLDINTLGNANASNRLVFVVICANKNSVIMDYANALGYRTYSVFFDNVSIDSLRSLISAEEKVILLIHGVK